MPIITEQMLDTNVGAQQVAPANTGFGQGLGQLANTASSILLDITEKRTETETNNAVAAYNLTSSDFASKQLEQVKSNADYNWTMDGASIKKNAMQSIQEFNKRAYDAAPNDVAREKIKLNGMREETAFSLQLEAINASKVLSESDKLITEASGQAIASLSLGMRGGQADLIYKDKVSSIQSLKSMAYTDPDKIDQQETSFVSSFAERFASNAIFVKPIDGLAAFSPELAMYALQKMKGSNLRDPNVNPLADIAQRGPDGKFYSHKFNPSMGVHQLVEAPIDPSLYSDDVLFVDTATKTAVVTQKKLLSDPTVPQFVKDAYSKNPEKMNGILNNLLQATLRRAQEDSSLKQAAIDENYKQTFTGKITQNQALMSKEYAASEDNLNSLNTDAEQLDNIIKANVPLALYNSVNELADSPVAGEQFISRVVEKGMSNLNSLVDSKDHRDLAMFEKLGKGDVEEGKRIYKEFAYTKKDPIAEEIRKLAKANQQEFVKDPGSYLRGRLSDQEKDLHSYFFTKGIFEKDIPDNVGTPLAQTMDSNLKKLQLWGYNSGTTSIGATKEEEKNIADFIKSNTTNPEAITYAVNNLNRFVGPRLTTEFLDRNGLSNLRSLLSTSNHPLRVQIAQAHTAMPKMLDQIKMRGIDAKTEIDDPVMNKLNDSELVNVIAAASGPNKNINASAIISDVKALAYHNMTSGNLSTKDAVNKAVSDYTSSFDFISDGGNNGKFYLYSTRGGMGNIQNVKGWMETRGASVDYLASKSLVIPEDFRKSSSGLRSEDELRNRWAKQVASKSGWYTNADATGAILMYRDAKNNLVPVPIEDIAGNKQNLEVSYEEINSYATQVRSSSLPIEDTEYPGTTGQLFNRGQSYKSELQRQIDISRFKAQSQGVQGISKDNPVSTSAAATYVSDEWLDGTMEAEGELSRQGNYSMDRLYVERKPRKKGGPRNFLHSMDMENFEKLNSPSNVKIVGETPVYTYKRNGKEYMSYLPLPPEKFAALSDEDKKKYYPTIEGAIRKTMKNWTRVSTNPEVARFMQHTNITQDQFYGIADIWHTMGASKLLGADAKTYPDHKQLGDLLREKKFKEALALIKTKESLYKELGANKFRFNRLARLFGGNRA